MLLLGACGSDSGAPADAAMANDAASDADPARALVPGERVGPIKLGARWADVVAALGAPPAEPVVLVRIGHVTWPAAGLEALLTSPAETTLTDDAIVIGAGATAGAALLGPALPGDTRQTIESVLGAAPEVYGGRAYYPIGLAVEYDDAQRARRVGVVAPYTLNPAPPPMLPSAGLP